jgi:hypothetical protein
MKILDKIINKLNIHENYIKKVKAEREKISDWTNKQLEGYVDSYFNHGFPMLRTMFGETILGEPPIIEACIEVYGQRITNNLYKPTN